MKNKKKGKETKEDELKRLKKVIKGLEEKAIVTHQEFVKSEKSRRNAISIGEVLERELIGAKGNIEVMRQKLTDIRKAIETVAAMRCPDAGIKYRAGETDTYYIPQTEPRPQPDESEDARLLRYLFELCN